MPNVIVTRPGTINVRVNQGNQQIVRSTSTFVGAANVQNIVETALSVAQNAYATSNVALNTAQNSYDVANTKYDKAGGHVYGDVIVDNNLTVANTIYANVETIDAGFF